MDRYCSGSLNRMVLDHWHQERSNLVAYAIALTIDRLDGLRKGQFHIIVI